MPLFRKGSFVSAVSRAGVASPLARGWRRRRSGVDGERGSSEEEKEERLEETDAAGETRPPPPPDRTTSPVSESETASPLTNSSHVEDAPESDQIEHDEEGSLSTDGVLGSRANRLVQELRNRNWQAAIRRVSRCPGEASEYVAVDVNGLAVRLLPLHYVCTLPDATIQVVRALLDTDPDTIAIAGPDGRLPLHWAVDGAGVSSEIVELLLEEYPASASVIEASNGFLPLHLACQRHDDSNDCRLRTSAIPQGRKRAIVKSLLATYPTGASIKDFRGWLPLHVAAWSGMSHDVVADLIKTYQHGILVGDDNHQRLPIHLACSRIYTSNSHDRDDDDEEDDDDDWDEEEMDVAPLVSSSKLAALQRIADAHPKSLHERESKYGWLPLHVACSVATPYKPVIELLLQRCPKAVSIVDYNGASPLHIAVRANAPCEVIETLLRAFPEGAGRPDNDGRLPLHYACQMKAPLTTVHALISAHPDGITVKESKYGMIPLHVSCMRGCPVTTIASLLTTETARERDMDGSLPIHLACKSTPFASTDCLVMLLEEYPESVHEKDEEGNVPIDIVRSATDSKSAPLLEVLERYTRSLERDENDSPGTSARKESSSGLSESLSERVRAATLAASISESNIVSQRRKRRSHQRSSRSRESSSSRKIETTGATRYNQGYERQERAQEHLKGEAGTPPIAAGDCVICLERKSTFVLYPCGHVCLCEVCAESSLASLRNVCPVGRCSFKDAVKLHGMM